MSEVCRLHLHENAAGEKWLQGDTAIDLPAGAKLVLTKESDTEWTLHWLRPLTQRFDRQAVLSFVPPDGDELSEA